MRSVYALPSRLAPILDALQQVYDRRVNSGCDCDPGDEYAGSFTCHVCRIDDLLLDASWEHGMGLDIRDVLDLVDDSADWLEATKGCECDMFLNADCLYCRLTAAEKQLGAMLPTAYGAEIFGIGLAASRRVGSAA